MLHILAVLVVIFADVAEVCRKGLHSQGTRDLSTFPLNDNTCHEDTDQNRAAETKDPAEITRLFQESVVTWPETRQGKA